MQDKSIRERFATKFKVNPDSGCWEWIGATDGRKGYGQIYFNGRTARASRVAWLLYKGMIPDGSHVCHLCDNPACVNPNHLFLGSRSDNMRDCVEKGRHGSVTRPERRPRGSGHYLAKLSEHMVIEARRLFREGVNCADLSSRYGIDDSTVRRALTGEGWNHVTSEPPVPRCVFTQVEGERHPQHKLTWSDVETIRKAHAEKTATIGDLAALHGVDPSTVGLVVRRRTWRGEES